MILVAFLVLLGVGIAAGGLWLLAEIFLEYRDELAEILPLFLCVASVGLLGAVAVVVHHLGG